MDILYKILGIKAIGDRICLTLSHVSEKKEFNTGKILTNLGGFMESMKHEAVSSHNPDQISITLEEYQKGNYDLGNVISISINSGEA